MQSIFVKTLGCKVNSFDSNALSNQLLAKGARVSESVDAADITVINSCSVTANAEKEARYLVRRYKKLNPKSYIVLTGCYAQTDSASLSRLDDVDYIVPNEVKEQAAELILESYKQRFDIGRSKLPAQVKAVEHNKQSHFKSSLTLFDHAESKKTRVFLKIQDGCNGFCTYCLIPYARGASRSVDPRQVLQEIERQTQRGVKEIVLTGIHIGDFGRDLPEYAADKQPIVNTLEQILQIPGAWRLRISSLEPGELSREMLEVLARFPSKFSPHFHLPLQSGSNRILKLMRRSYTAEDYAACIQMTREFFPDACFGADVIPGFPSENDEDFAATISLLQAVGMNYLHVFPYSARPNTAAVRMPDHIAPAIIKERAKILRDYSKEWWQDFSRQFIGKEVDVVWEQDVDNSGRRRGYSAHYLQVAASGKLEITDDSIQQVEVIGFVDHAAMLVQ